LDQVEYAEKELNELMRKYKENEVNKEIFFEEEKAEKIRKQREENETRKKMAALENEKKDDSVVTSEELQQTLETPIHPAEGGPPREL
jgi:hypothetical protein